ncbi:MAG: winged helix-turn-helix domain-containing protein [bacterium]
MALSIKEVQKILELCRNAQPITDLMKNHEWKDRTKFKNKFLKPLIELNIIAMTIPDKPNSSKQKYIITENGSELLNSLIQQ